MVGFARGESQKAVWSEWHEERERARRTAFSLAEFSDEEINKYDLDTADVNGQDNPDTYTWNRPLFPTERHDVREQDDR